MDQAVANSWRDGSARSLCCQQAGTGRTSQRFSQLFGGAAGVLGYDGRYPPVPVYTKDYTTV